ncbi:MAG: hypothetical protein J5957_08620 [Prevotella sp.]|nr:hypothetical protein [Prevotella sp.]
MKWFFLIWFILFILCGIASYKWEKMWEKHERKHGIYRTKTKKRRKWNWTTDYPYYS